MKFDRKRLTLIFAERAFELQLIPMSLVAECSAGAGHHIVVDVGRLDGIHNDPIDRLVGSIPSHFLAGLDAANFHHAGNRLQAIERLVGAVAGGLGMEGRERQVRA